MNRKLAEYSSRDLDKTLHESIDDLIRKFTFGEIDSYRVRIFFFNQIRDEISIQQEVFYRKTMEKKLSDAILKGVQNPSDEDVELGMSTILKPRPLDYLDAMRVRVKFNSVIQFLSEDKKKEWMEIFNSTVKILMEK